MAELDQLLIDILSTPSPSGCEGVMQSLCRRTLEPFASDIYTDSIGNLIATIATPSTVEDDTKKKKRLMLAAHCDEISCMVTGYGEDGLIFFAPVAGLDPQVVAGQRVVIHTSSREIQAVIGKKAIHLQSSRERELLFPFEELVVDAGFATRDEATVHVAIGDRITFATMPQILGNSRFAGRGLDDRVGIYVLLETVKRLAQLPLRSLELMAVSTVQEEVGLRGATVGSYSVSPELAIIIESGHATDTPGIKSQLIGDIKLGRGAVLSRGPNIDEALFTSLKRVADRDGIPLQIKPEPRPTGTDANVVQISEEGVKTALVRFPIRYMHSPNEVADLNDVEALIELLVAGIVEIDKSFA